MPAIIDYEPLDDCPRGVTSICRKCNQCGRWDNQDPDEPTGLTKKAIERFRKKHGFDEEGRND